MPGFVIEKKSLSFEVDHKGKGFTAAVYDIDQDTQHPAGEATDKDPFRAIGKAVAAALDKMTNRKVTERISDMIK